MDPSTLRLLLDYNSWATGRILDAAGRVTPEQFVAPTNATMRSLRGTLVHMLDGEWSWRLRLQGRSGAEWRPEEDLQPEDFPTVAALAQRWREEERQLRAYATTLSAQDLIRVVDLGRVNDLAPPDRFPLWYFLQHVLNHSSMSRADAATLLTLYGQSPGDIDFLNFADTLPAGAAEG
jgi:uncharacterized damage-inducible protein DinB